MLKYQNKKRVIKLKNTFNLACCLYCLHFKKDYQTTETNKRLNFKITHKVSCHTRYLQYLHKKITCMIKLQIIFTKTKCNIASGTFWVKKVVYTEILPFSPHKDNICRLEAYKVSSYTGWFISLWNMSKLCNKETT